MTVPTGCRARHQFILDTACDLAQRFRNGNRADVAARLDEFPARVATAIVATMVADGLNSLAPYLREIA